MGLAAPIARDVVPSVRDDFRSEVLRRAIYVYIYTYIHILIYLYISYIYINRTSRMRCCDPGSR